MADVWAILYIIPLVLSLALLIFSLPGNWMIVALVAVWKLMHADAGFSWQFVAFIGGIALAGEGMELAFQLMTGRKAGSTKRGNIGGFVGLIVGAILGAPIFFGLGALPGALLGAYAGCLIMEHNQGRPWPEAKKAAMGVLVGSFLGLIAKFGLGVVILVLSIPRLFLAQ